MRLELAWRDGKAAEVSAECLRAACRCAWCTRARIDGTFAASFDAITIDRLTPVGDYAINIAFSDGHARGIYPWAYLHRIAETHDRLVTKIASGAAASGASSGRNVRMTSDCQNRSDRGRSSRSWAGAPAARWRRSRPRRRIPACASFCMEKANVKRSGAISHGHGRTEQRRHSRLRHARAVRQGDHRSPTTASFTSKAVMAYAQGSYPMIRYLDQLGRQVREGRIRRLQRPQGAPHGHLCAADAGGHRRQEDPVPAAAARCRSPSPTATWRRAC